jgi:hypothetical protein
MHMKLHRSSQKPKRQNISRIENQIIRKKRNEAEEQLESETGEERILCG